MVAERLPTDTTLNNNLVYEWVLHTTFTASARANSVQQAAPYLRDLVRPEDHILDLCCGTGPISFWFAEQGAEVTGVDLAPYMIALAKEEALRRSTSVNFVEADIFTYELDCGGYDLISCFGNSISDFPLSAFVRLLTRVFGALKPGGRFVLEYHDGSYQYMHGTAAREGVYQEKPERITFHFENYLPEIGACVYTIHNETCGETYQRRHYVYTVPVVEQASGGAMELERHIVLAENHFLDIFVKCR
jgi:SAM-dependent methyltransferase